MSTATRQAISDAANTVPEVSCTPHTRVTTRTGDAMVRLGRMNRSSNGFGFVNTWQVLVILPQDLTAAEKYLDTLIPSLIPAVSEELVITSITPQELVLETGTTIPCCVIEGSRESDI